MAVVTAGFYVSRLQQLCGNPTASKLIGNKAVKLIHSSTTLKNKALNSKLYGFFTASDKKVQKLQLRDKISKDYTLVYNAPMENYIKYGYPFTLSLTLAAPGIMFYSFYIHGKIFLQKEAHSVPFFNPEQEIWIFAGSVFLLAWAIFALMYKYPLRIYKHNEKQKYIAMYASAVPFQLQKFHFQSATRRKFWNPLYFFIDQDLHYFLDNKKKAFLFTYYFRTPADLSEMEATNTLN